MPIEFSPWRYVITQCVERQALLNINSDESLTLIIRRQIIHTHMNMTQLLTCYTHLRFNVNAVDDKPTNQPSLQTDTVANDLD
jgi:hypothetical protein